MHICSYNVQLIQSVAKSISSFSQISLIHPFSLSGWSDGEKVLCKFSVPGRPTNLDNRRARAFCACSRCGWGLFGHFFSPLSFLFSSPSLGDEPI